MIRDVILLRRMSLHTHAHGLLGVSGAVIAGRKMRRN